METKGMFKRIAAVTLASLTVMTSSGIDYNMLSANAAEAAGRVTDASTETVFKKKDTKVNASSKISFSTNAELKSAVEDGNYNIDVKTNAVKVATIKYKKTALQKGTDFTASAKRTSVKKVNGKYNYVYTVTITGKGKFTGTAKKTGVTMISTVKPTTTTKKKTVKKADAVESITIDAEESKTNGTTVTPNSKDKTVTLGTGDEKWKITFFGNPVIFDPNGEKKIAYFGDGQNDVGVSLDVYFGDSTDRLREGTDYKQSIINQHSIGDTENAGSFTITPTSSFIKSHPTAKILTVRFMILESVLAQTDGTGKYNGVKLTLGNNESYAEQTSSGLWETSHSKDKDYSFEYSKNDSNLIVSYRVNSTYYKTISEADRGSAENISTSNGITTMKISPIFNRDYSNGTRQFTLQEKADIYYTIGAKSLTDNYKYDASGITIDNIDDQTYTGTEIKPEVVVKDNSDKNADNNANTLVAGTDYEVSYTNNINAAKSDSTNAPTITIKGKGNYTGEITKTFTIKAKEIKAVDVVSGKEITLSGFDTSYTGQEVKPVPTIIYKPSDKKTEDGKQVENVLSNTNDKDFKIEYYKNNTDKHSTTETTLDDEPADTVDYPYAKITFNGNYSGTIYQPFSIGNGDISLVGTEVIIGDNTSTSHKIAGNETDTTNHSATIDMSSDANAIEYSPVSNEYPLIHINNAAGKSLVLDTDKSKNVFNNSSSYSTEKGDYYISKAEWQGTSAATWPSVGTWNIKIVGEGSYSGSSIVVTIQVKALSLKSNKISVSDKKFEDDGNSYVALKYTNDSFVKENITSTGAGTSVNFTISPENNKDLKADKNFKFTITGQNNYTDTLDIPYGYGKDLSKAILTKNNDAKTEIRIREFDPFTGEELTGTTDGSSIAMPYYGDDIYPQYSVEIASGSGTWTPVSSGYFKPTHNSDTKDTSNKNYLYTDKVTLTATDDNPEIYGSIDLTYYVVAHSLVKLSPSETDSDTLSEDINKDISDISSKTDINDIRDNLHLTLKPARAGQFVYLIEKDGTVKPNYIENSNNTTEIKKVINDKKPLAYWYADKFEDGQLLTIDKDYTVKVPDDSNDNFVWVTGIGKYTDTAKVSLDQDDIGSKDFYIVSGSTSTKENETSEQETLPDIDYDEDEHRPEIELYKRSRSKQIADIKLTKGTDYRVSYENPNGELTNKEGYLINEAGKLINKDGNEVSNGVMSTNGFAQPGEYKIILNGTATGSATTTTPSYFGKRIISYKIKASDSKLSARFSPSSNVPYQCDFTTNSDSTATPELDYYNNTSDTKAKRLIVTAEGDSTPLKKDKDFKVVYNESDLKTPGEKTFNIIGINKYKGQEATASYKVTVHMGELYKTEKALLKSDPDMSAQKPLVLYYDGGTVLKNGDGIEFVPQEESIELASGTRVDESNYTITYDGSSSVSKLYSAGSHYITFTGNGAYLDSYTLQVEVIVTRANLLWAGDSTTEGGGTTNLILPWTSKGYTLGQGAMTLYKEVNGKKETVKLTSKDTITITLASGSGTSSDSIDSGALLNNVGKYEVTIKGPLPSDDSTKLTFSILYDLSNVNINIKKTSEPYSGKDPYDEDGDKILDGSLITVEFGTHPLIYGTDYGVIRHYTDKQGDGDYSRAGTIEIFLEPMDNHSKFFGEEHTVTYTITQLKEDDNYQLDAGENNPLYTYMYNGKRQSPEGSESTIFDTDGKVTYKDGDTTHKLVYGTDYTVSYQSDSTNAGWKYVIISGIGNYAGSKIFENAYYIKPYDLSSNKTKIKIPDQYYTGKAIIPQKIQVTDVTGDLVFGIDYTIENPKNNTESGTQKASVDVKGTDKNFTGTADGIKFAIKKLNLTTLGNSDGFITHTDATYNKGASVGVDDHIQVFIPDGSSKLQLTRGTDYTLEFTKDSADSATDPTNAGDYTVTIKAVTDSKFVEGSTTVSFKINPLNIEDIADQFSVADAEWTGKQVTPNITLNGKTIDSNYSVSWKNNIAACGKSRAEMLQYDPNFDENKIPTVTITGKGNYVGIIKKTFQIGQPFSEATITPTSNTRLTYNGSSQKKEYTVTYTDGTGTRQTLATSRYTVKYPDNTTDAGDKVVLFTANGGPLYGTKTVTYTIYPVSGSVWSVEFTNLVMDSTGQYTVQYQGAAITPEVKAYVLGAGGSRTEIPLKSGEIKYANNTAAGTASVSVSPNNYEGTKTLYFKILGVDISGDNVYAAFTDGITRRKYTGSALTPAVTVTFAGNLGTVTLTKDRDFSLTYENNTNAGAADVKITGIGNYSGTRTLNFDIFANFNDKTSVFTIPKQMYTGEPITELSGATIKAGGNNLVLGTDYTLAITSTDSYRTKGMAIFTAQSKYYEGTRTVQFEIGNDASMYTVLGVAATYVYDRQAHKPVPVVTDKQGTVYSVDSVTYASTSDGDSCINAGNVKMQIVITSHGQSVTIPYNYIIEPRNINTAAITPIADVDYNGKAHTPIIRVTDGTNLLTGSPTASDGSADYTYTYFNNTDPGTATVSIQGINNYTGVTNVYFAINVKAAPQMIVTAMPSGRLKVTWNKVSGVSGYRIFYSSASGTQKQTILSSSKKSTYITGLTRGVVYTVGLQSFITANGQNGYSSASVQQIATSTAKPTITSAKSTGKGKIKITWKKVSNATAYMVYRKTAGSSKWTRVKTTKSTSFTNTGLKSGKKYTYKVISYKQSGVKRSFSKYSTGKTVKAK